MKKSLILFLSIFYVFQMQSQIAVGELTGGLNTITTAVPFLLISPDSRAGAMGDVGVATTPDASSMHWNPAKYAFVEDDMGFAINYVPWLRSLVPDISLSYLSGYLKRNDNDGYKEQCIHIVDGIEHIGYGHRIQSSSKIDVCFF